MLKFLTVLTILVSLSVFAEEATTVRKRHKKVEETKVPSYVWPNFFTMEYSPETSKQNNSNIYYYLELNHHLNYTHHFRWVQRVSHQVVPEEGKENGGEMAILNPRFNYYYNFKEPKDKSYQLALRIGSELGTSITSRQAGINAISMVRLEFSKKFGFTTVQLRPYAAYWSTQYATNELNEPLPLMSFGHNLFVTTLIGKKWTWNVELDTGFQMFQPAELKQAQTFAPANAEPLETSKSVLFFGTDIGYLILKNLQVRLGYYQFDKFVSEGRYELNLLSDDTTRYYLGLDYVF